MERWIIPLVSIWLWASMPTAFAQRCADTFPVLDETCARTKENTFNDKAITVSTELVGNVYFYRTNTNRIGKLQIVSVATEKERSNAEKRQGIRECVVYFEATTFLGNKTYSPGSILNIKSEYNHWQQDSLSLDRNGANDLTLMRDGEKCVLKPVTAKWAFYKKMDADQAFTGGSPILYWAALFLMGLAVFLVARATLEEENKFKAGETLEEADADKRAQANDFVLKYSRPFFKRYFTPIVMGMKGRQKLKTKFRRKLANAGLVRDLTPEDFFAFKVFLIIGFPIVFIILRIAFEETWSMSLIPVLAVLGFFYPDIWINGRIERRKDEMIRSMPFIVDMLALSVEAGLDFMAAIQKVIEKAPPSPLVEEFETLIRETRIGSTRAEGLRQLAWRTDVISINSFCATLIAADSVGASIAPLLKQLSNEMRQKRSSEAEKKGATAATKILFPMILFIMPAVMIAIGGPMFVKFLGGN